jgi:hypothetical protein
MVGGTSERSAGNSFVNPCGRNSFVAGFDAKGLVRSRGCIGWVRCLGGYGQCELACAETLAKGVSGEELLEGIGRLTGGLHKLTVKLCPRHTKQAGQGLYWKLRANGFFLVIVDRGIRSSSATPQLSGRLAP